MTRGPGISITEDDLSSSETIELVRLHLGGMHASSPPGQVFALDLSGLKARSVTFFSARIGGRVAGIGALKELDAASGEVKSMRTHPEFLRRGVGSAMLEAIIREAKGRGMRILSLETGRGPAFDAALTLYRRRGFVDGPAFGDYKDNGFSQFLRLEIA